MVSGGRSLPTTEYLTLNWEAIILGMPTSVDSSVYRPGCFTMIVAGGGK